MYKNIVFKGGENHIEFAGLVRGPDAKQKIPGRISYDFSKNTSSILRKEQPYWQAIKEEQAEGAGEELISGVVELNISYCYQEKDSEAIAWFDEWLSEEKIPAGVKLELIIKDDYSPQGQIIFSKRINIPVGELIGMEELKND